MLNPRSSSATRRALVDETGDRSRLRYGSKVEGAAFGPDLELLLEVGGRLDRGVVVGLRVDQVVEDVLVGGRLFGLAPRSAGSPRRCFPSTRP